MAISYGTYLSQIDVYAKDKNAGDEVLEKLLDDVDNVIDQINQENPALLFKQKSAFDEPKKNMAIKSKRPKSLQVDFHSVLQAEIAQRVLKQFGIKSNISRDGVVEAYFEETDISFSECPKIPEAKEMIKRTKVYMVAEHPSDTNMAEVASIGHNYTFHTHPRGTLEPSEADIETTRNLKKELLCIGLVPQKKVLCYSAETLEKVCEHPA